MAGGSVAPSGGPPEGASGYRRRVVDAELDTLLPGLAAISLEGPKGVGKTATASRRAASIVSCDDSAQAQVLRAAPERLRELPRPVLIDEWQREPWIWDAVRREVDAGAAAGSFLLTGSAAVPSGVPLHSGAGRIVQLRMRPMSLAERGLAAPTVSLAALLDGPVEVTGASSLSLADYADQITRSGFPAVRTLEDRLRRLQLDGYLARIVEREFAQQGRAVRRPATLRAWLAGYAAATSTTTGWTRILEAATPGEAEKPAKTTVLAYRDVLTELWLLDPVEGWTPTRTPLHRLTSAPKHHLADPALAARLLHVDAAALLTARPGQPALPQPGPLLGALFESLVAMSVRTYAQAAEATVAHLRTREGLHEIDLMVTRHDGRCVALEVKLGAVADDRDVRHLLWLRRELGSELADCAVLTTGSQAYRRPDGIAVIPAALLGP